MKSPFPGMDPYLEKHWGDVHHSLIQYTRDALQPLLPADLLARVEERVFVESESGRRRQVVPDAHVSQAFPSPSASPFEFKDGDSIMAEPLVFEVNNPLITEGYVEIRELSGGKVITVIEFLSPANKSGGMGQEKYLEKQEELLRSDATLLEIDLVRAGRRVLALAEERIPQGHERDYVACLSPGWKRNRRELYLIPLRQRLPSLPVALRQTDARVKLNLQLLVDQVYANGRYHNLDYTADLQPPLPEADAAWAHALLQQPR